MTNRPASSKFDYGAYFGRIRDLERLAVAPAEVSWREKYVPPKRSVDVVLYLGCNVLITSHLAVEVVAVLKHLGIDFEAVGGPQFCCGIIHHTQGDRGASTRLSQATVDKLKSYGAETLIMWCPSCDLHFDEVVLPEIDRNVAPTITHATQFLADRATKLPFQFDVPCRVAVHTHGPRPAQERDAKACLDLLAAVPGVEIVGTIGAPELGYHCATPLTAEARHTFKTRREQLLNEARTLGADTVVTIYHSCHREWCEEDTADLTIRNYISIVAAALGCGAQDRHGTLRRAGSAAAVTAVSEPEWRAHGWDESRAQRAAQWLFSDGSDEGKDHSAGG